MMPLREDAAPSELTTALLDGHAEHGDATVGVAEEDLRLSDGDDSDYEIVPTRETLVFDDEYGARRVALDDAKAAGFFQMYLMDKIQPGSVKGSMFTMTVAIVGAGVLALPYAFQFVHLGYAPDIMYQLHHLRLFDWRPHRLLTAIPLVIFVYTCHPNVLPIYLVLKRRSSRRMYKVMNRSIGLSAAVYCLCGAFVVFTFGEHTKSNFLKNDYHRDVAVLIGCIGFSVALILTVPLFLHTLRDNLREALLENRRLSVVQHAIVSAFLVFSVFTVAELSGDIASVLGVLGATTNPVICFLLPAYFVHRVGPASLATRKWIALVIAMLASAVSVGSVLHQLQVLA
ncbi:hypothetical protein ATCC90586_003513 [Pythium insidiosum]|nr:hypothetical protein ATCC90586_003513 [Pythium insidiosum]